MDKRTPDEKQWCELHIRELKKLVRDLKACHEHGHEVAPMAIKVESVNVTIFVAAELQICLAYRYMIEALEAKIGFLESLDKEGEKELPKEFKIPDKLSDFMKGGGGSCGN